MVILMSQFGDCVKIGMCWEQRNQQRRRAKRGREGEEGSWRPIELAYEAWRTGAAPAKLIHTFRLNKNKPFRHRRTPNGNHVENVCLNTHIIADHISDSIRFSHYFGRVFVWQRVVFSLMSHAVGWCAEFTIPKCVSVLILCTCSIFERKHYIWNETGNAKRTQRKCGYAARMEGAPAKS